MPLRGSDVGSVEEAAEGKIQYYSKALCFDIYDAKQDVAVQTGIGVETHEAAVGTD